jgi:thiol-disulfide isomerase/thioredoxin
MRRWFISTVALLFSVAYVFAQSDAQQNLPDYGPAPELHDSVWLNTESALRLQDLRGQVVLLDMWTFGCINCIRTIPYLRTWHDTYSDQGLVVIGNHYPEFNFEHDLNNLKDALVRLDVSYPVVQDNRRETWNAYNNRYWPTLYLIDKQGRLRYRHIGEGRYAQTEAAIQTLLAEDYQPQADATLMPEPLISLTPIDVLNVRSGPGTDHERIGSIAPGEVYVAHAEQNGWYTINFQGQTGYVSGEYVELS